jgi:hypothetical protein
MLWCGACLFIIPSTADQAQAASEDGKRRLGLARAAKRSRVHVKVGARGRSRPEMDGFIRHYTKTDVHLWILL